MEILEILEKQGNDLYPEDLDFFETELATGGDYDTAYVTQCKQKISGLRAWIINGNAPDGREEETPQSTKTGKAKGLVVSIGDLAPEDANQKALSLTTEQIIYRDISSMRKDSAYKTNFKSYVRRHTEIDAAFIEAHFSFFQPWEMDAVVSVRQLGEEFLEKYFGALNHDKIARYQQFSEGFFMKHFAQLNPDFVLLHGKNEWRKKGNRSKQLDVFLRLKGITY